MNETTCTASSAAECCFETWDEYRTAALAALHAHPKGTGIRHGDGFLVLIHGEPCFINAGADIDDHQPGEPDAWTHEDGRTLYASLAKTEFAQCFTAEQVSAYEML